MSEDYTWLFSDKDLRKDSIKRLTDDTDINRLPSFDKVSSRFSPEMDEYLSSPSLSKRDSSFSPASDVVLSKDDLGHADPFLAEKANTQLEEAIKHLEVNQKTLDALTTIIRSLDKNRESYHRSHPTPGEFDEELSDPAWSSDFSDKKKR